MTNHEIFIQKPEPIDCAAEGMFADIKENLLEFENGMRAHFDAYFPLNLDESGQGLGVHDRAHELFVASLQPEVAAEDHLVLPSGVKLFYKHLYDPDTNKPHSAHYSDEPLPFVDNDQLRSAAFSPTDTDKSVLDQIREIREIARETGKTAVEAFAEDIKRFGRWQS